MPWGALSRDLRPATRALRGSANRANPHPASASHEKMRGLIGKPIPQNTQEHPMDIERINAIGTALNDLSQRTLDLRGYL